MSAVAYFCEKTGVRIAAPGVCKAVDPANGQDEYKEPAAAEAQPSKSHGESAKPKSPEKPADTKTHHSTHPSRGDDK